MKKEKKDQMGGKGICKGVKAPRVGIVAGGTLSASNPESSEAHRT